MKVVNMGNIADAFKFDDLPATGIVIEATPEELELLPNLAYKDVTISEHVGNAAKIREAVENALDRLLLWNYTDQYTARMALGVVKKLHAAISAPPHNCDRLECSTTKAAQDVWRKEDGARRRTTNGYS